MYSAMVGDCREAVLGSWVDAHHDRWVEGGRIPKQLQSLLSHRLTIHNISVKIENETIIYHHHHMALRMIKPVVVLSPGPSLMQATRPPPTLRGPPVKFNLQRILMIWIRNARQLIQDVCNVHGDTSRSILGEVVRKREEDVG